MAVGEFFFRGKKLEELKQMDTREFAKYVNANARRSILRNFDSIERFVAKNKKKQDKGKPVRTHERGLVIVPKMVGIVIFIHNGKEFVKILITEEMLGHRLGEFVPTRQKVQHGAPGIGATRSSAALSVK